MRYPGGKGKCYQRIINLMPPHTTYIESHLGGGAVLRHKKPANLNIGIDVDANVIARWEAEHPTACHLVHGDATSFLAEYPYAGGELVYSDPPYVKSTRRQAKVYRHDLEDHEHRRLLETLKTLPCLVMISGYDSELYRAALVGWHFASFSARTRVDMRKECIWCNFMPPARLHEGTHLGATFRERQAIKRRHQRWLERLDDMPPAERNHLLALIQERYTSAAPSA
jgi:DNA adenine methylase